MGVAIGIGINAESGQKKKQNYLKLFSVDYTSYDLVIFALEVLSFYGYAMLSEFKISTSTACRSARYCA